MPNLENRKETLESLLQKQKEIEIQKSLVIEDDLNSRDPERILKASNYIEQNKDNSGNLKSFLYAPDRQFYSGNGYLNPVKGVTFDMLRGMGRTPVINAIISTRMNQVKRFSEFTTDVNKEGWTIRKRLSRFELSEGKYKPNSKDKQVIDKIATFLENGGEFQKWDNQDDFQEFLDKILEDSLTLDQGCFENERNRRGDLVSFSAVDGATIRLLESIDKKAYDLNYNFGKEKGFKPTYCQVWNNEIIKNKAGENVIFYPWELGYVVRNKTSNIRNNGYGISELEILIEIITWLLWGMQYNGNFFKQGSHPKGFFSIEGNLNQSSIDEFRQAWRNMVSGVQNAHKVPIFQGNSKVQWNDMMHSNKDMEFQNWNDFLIVIACSVYKIDPSELGYSLQKSSNIFGQDGQRERLDHSKQKGLKPILVTLQKAIDKYIVSELDSGYEFIFTGIDLEDEKERIELNKLKLESGQASLESVFEQMNDRKFDPKKDTILNSVYWQAQQSKMYGGDESNAAVDQMTGEPEEGVQNPFEEYAKSLDSNPIANKALDYINKNFAI